MNLRQTPKSEETPISDDYQHQIRYVINQFDFQKVHTAMTALDWTWWDTKPDVPSISRMQETTKGLLEEAFKLNSPCDTYVSSGGFKAEVFSLNNGTKRCSLSFIVEESDST